MKKSDLYVLIVEDDPSFRVVLDEAFKRAGYRTFAVGKADEALSYVKIKPIHAAVIDCMLPKMNGVDLAMAMRKQNLQDVPIFLMSGVFRDKSFADSSVKKAHANGFLHKPFEIADLVKDVEKALQSKISAPKVALHALLSQPYASSRERRKALEQIEEAIGFDVPLILSILMDDELSGHLNFLNTAEELFGVTLLQGKIIKVDSADTASTTSLLLTQHGFAKSEELVEFKSQKRKGDFLNNLVEAQMISPHAANFIRREQMFTEIRRILTEERFQLTVAPDRKLKSDIVGVSLDEMTTFFHQAVDQSLSGEWLKKFYQSWMEHPIRKGPQFEAMGALFDLPMLSKLEGFRAALGKEPTLAQLLTSMAADPIRVLKSLHMLALRRVIVFDETKASNEWPEKIERVRKMAEAFENKNPFEVFSYFGLGTIPRVSDVERVYMEFVKTYHPDKLDPKADVQTKNMFNRVFGIVSEAHNALCDDNKRQKLEKQMKEKSAQVHLQSERMLDEAIQHLKKNENARAKSLMDSVFANLKTDESKMYWAWATLKSNDRTAKMNEIADLLAGVGQDQRAQPLFHFVTGLYKAAAGDRTSAMLSFQKALEIDKNYIDARREMSRLGGGTNPKVELNSVNKILNADLGELARSIFKKKSG